MLSVNAFAADACVFNWSQFGECFSFFNLYEIVSKFRFELSQSERRAIWLKLRMEECESERERRVRKQLKRSQRSRSQSNRYNRPTRRPNQEIACKKYSAYGALLWTLNRVNTEHRSQRVSVLRVWQSNDRRIEASVKNHSYPRCDLFSFSYIWIFKLDNSFLLIRKTRVCVWFSRYLSHSLSRFLFRDKTANKWEILRNFTQRISRWNLSTEFGIMCMEWNRMRHLHWVYLSVMYTWPTGVVETTAFIVFGKSFCVVGERYESSLKTSRSTSIALFFCRHCLLSLHHHLLHTPFHSPQSMWFTTDFNSIKIAFGASHFLICLKAAAKNEGKQCGCQFVRTLAASTEQQQSNSNENLLNSCFSH